MFSLPRAVYVLFVSAILVGSTMPMNVLIGGLIGQTLAPLPWMATLPITCIVVGTALGTFPAVKLMQQYGRKIGFITGLFVSFVAQFLAIFALYTENFFLFCGCAMLTGVSIASLQQMRFAAVEYAGKDKASLAISVVMLHGVFAAILGPELGAIVVLEEGSEAYSAESFAPAYLALAGVLALAMIWTAIALPKVKAVSANTKEDSVASAASPIEFWVAVVASVTAFAVMSYLMTATPMSMHHHFGFDLAQAKSVIQWHILAMFLPSLFTGRLITMLGQNNSLLLGWLLFLMSCVIAYSGHSFAHFWISLVVLGVGWNILFTTGTTILSLAGANHSQQARHDFMVFSSQALATVAAGATLLGYGWSGVVVGSMLALLPCLVVVLVLKQRRLVVDS